MMLQKERNMMHYYVHVFYIFITSDINVFYRSYCNPDCIYEKKTPDQGSREL